MEKLPELNEIAIALKSLKNKNIIRTKNLVGDLGEYYCKKLFNLKLEDNAVNKGFDAIDVAGKKVEIKTRRIPEGKSKVIFRGFDFDYCLYVELNEYFEPLEILKLDVEEIKNNLEKSYKRLSVSKIKKLNSTQFNQFNF
ncbi:MAG: hypothetical protein IE891_02685 [Flavobacteriaceae bacterium]|nr:hypothetical protein [Flavobacteriaceae bacterium]